MKETLNFALSVNPATPALVIVDGSGNPLNDGDSVTLNPQTVGTADSQTLFVVSGGVAPYSFALTDGAKPDGEEITSTVNDDSSETVKLEGTPTTAGEANFALVVSDSAGQSKTFAAKRVVA